MTTRRRRAEDTLPPGLAFFLVHGWTPAPDECPGLQPGAHNGVFEAFDLEGRWIRSRYHAADRRGLLGELQALWEAHEGQLREAAGDDEPWVLEALRGLGLR